jgi:hypothetical protein
MSASKQKIVLKKLSSHNTIWHPESTLVFKSQKERLVIGRLVDGDIQALDEEAVRINDEGNWNFSLDESLLASEDDETHRETAETLPTGENCSEEDGEQVESVEYVESVDPDSEEVRESEFVRKVGPLLEFGKILEQKILDRDREIFALRGQLEELQNKCNMMETKFQTMKSLFS